MNNNHQRFKLLTSTIECSESDCINFKNVSMKKFYLLFLFIYGAFWQLNAQCTAPANINTNTTVINGKNSVVITWDDVPAASRYTVLFRTVGAMVFTQKAASTNTRSIQNLSPNTEYEIRIRSICPGGEIATSESVFFTSGTAGESCPAPSTLQAIQENVSGYHTTVLSWDAVPEAKYYIAFYRLEGTNSFRQRAVVSNNVRINNLNPGSVYLWKVRTVCEWDFSSSSPEDSQLESFTTGSGSNCDFTSNLSSSNLTLSGFNATQMSWDPVAGAAGYVVQYKVPDNSVPWNSKEVFGSNTTIAGGLLPNTQYDFRVQTICNDDPRVRSEDPLSSQMMDWVESSFTTGNLGTTCPTPTNVRRTGETGSGGSFNSTFSWNAVPGATSYIVSYALGGRVVMEKTVSQTSVTLNGLTTEFYTFNVRAECASDENIQSGRSATIQFTPGLNCIAPTGLTAVPDISGGFNVANLTWNNVPDAESYLVFYRPVGTTTWQSGSTPGSGAQITGLLSNTEYEWRVRSVCNASGNVLSPYSAIDTFTTLGGGECEVPTNLSATPGESGGLLNATLNWDAVTSALQYRVLYRPVGTATFQSKTVGTNSALINGLLSDTEYEWQVRSICNASGTIVSAYSPLSNFTTLTGASCNAPNNLSAVPGTSGALVNVDLSWDDTPAADHYLVIYRPVGTSTWQGVRTDDSNALIEGLLSETQYQWQVRIFCDEEETIGSIYAVGDNFTTLAGSACDTPVNLSAVPGDTGGQPDVSLSWDEVTAADHYLVVYRPVGTSTWSGTRPATNSTVLINLLPETQYEWMVRTFCDAAETIGSPYSNMQTFTTLTIITCETTTGLSAIPGTSGGLNSADLSWDDMPNANSYRVLYRPVGTSTFQSKITSTNSTTIVGLNPLTNYEWAVQTRCGSDNSVVATLSSFDTFTTGAGLSCDAPFALVSVPGLGMGIPNATLSWDPVVAADHYFVIYRRVGTGTWSGVNSEINSVTIQGLSSLADYEWQVRTFCDEGETIASAYSPTANFTTLAGTSCDVPTGLMATPGVGGSGLVNATLNWDDVPAADHYLVVYRQIGTSTWLSVSPSTNSAFIDGLVSDANYEWMVRTWCDPGETIGSSYSTTATFTTLSGNSCELPAGYDELPSSNDVVLGWSFVPAADHYFIIYRQVGAPTWKGVTTTNTSVIVTGLTPDTNYEWRLRTFCTPDASVGTPYSPLRMFSTTPTSSAGPDGPDFFDQDKESPFARSFEVYPNPTTGSVTLELPTSKEVKQVFIMDMVGKQVMQATIESSIVRRELNLQYLQRGVYNIVLISEGQGMVNKRLILQ